jgi:hypothetical protein
MGEFFLRQAFGPPILSQIERQHLSDFHPRDGAALSSISPRSILDKTRDRRFLGARSRALKGHEFATGARLQFSSSL